MHCRHSDGGGEIVGRVGRGRVDEEREGFERVQVVVEGVRHGGEEGTLLHSVGSKRRSSLETQSCGRLCMCSRVEGPALMMSWL